jgi:hypothetical protein
MIMSPTPASGSLLRWAPNPQGPIKKMDLAPLLSAQLRTAPTGRPRVRRNLVPEAPPPVKKLVWESSALHSKKSRRTTSCSHFEKFPRRMWFLNFRLDQLYRWSVNAGACISHTPWDKGVSHELIIQNKFGLGRKLISYSSTAREGNNIKRQVDNRACQMSNKKSRGSY